MEYESCDYEWDDVLDDCCDFLNRPINKAWYTRNQRRLILSVIRQQLFSALKKYAWKLC